MSLILTLRLPLVSVCITVLVRLVLVRIFASIYSYLIFVLSVRIKQAILFVCMNVFNCHNDVVLPVLLSVRFDNIRTGHLFFIFVFLLNKYLYE